MRKSLLAVAAGCGHDLVIIKQRIAMDDTPYFHALASFACKANRLYRIYVKPLELVFIWAGSGGEGLAGAAALTRFGEHAFTLQGMLYQLMGKGMQKVLDPSKKNDARAQVLDTTPLARLTRDHPANFKAPTGGFETLRIGPRSDRHARAYSDHGHQALLHLKHRKFGKLRLGLCSIEDVQAAMEVLPGVMGSRYSADITRPVREQACGCRFCR